MVQEVKLLIFGNFFFLPHLAGTRPGWVGWGRGRVFSERERVSKSEIPLRDVVFVPRV